MRSIHSKTQSMADKAIYGVSTTVSTTCFRPPVARAHGGSVRYPVHVCFFGSSRMSLQHYCYFGDHGPVYYVRTTATESVSQTNLFGRRLPEGAPCRKIATRLRVPMSGLSLAISFSMACSTGASCRCFSSVRIALNLMNTNNIFTVKYYYCYFVCPFNNGR